MHYEIVLSAHPEPPSLADLTAYVERVRAFLATVQPAQMFNDEAVPVIEFFITLERLAAAGKTLFAFRIADSEAWMTEGHTSPASWLAQRTDGTLGDAMSTIDTSRSLRFLDDTTDALRSGTLSTAKVREVARAAVKDPASERELLQLAGSETYKVVKDRSRQVIAGSAMRVDEIERFRAVHRARHLRHFTDETGAFRLDASLTPDIGARLLSSIDAEADALFDEARRTGERERPDAYRVDALVNLVCGDARTGPHATEDAASSEQHETSDAPTRVSRAGRNTDRIVIRVDADALRRSWAMMGEVCEIRGIGQVPVAVVTALLPSAFAEVVIKDGVDVLNVCRVGRTVTAHVESALEERDPRCVVPGCDVTRGLEKHHFRENFALSGRTSLGDLARVCRRHHDMITYDGFVLGGGPGAWTFRGASVYDVGLADTG